MADNTKSSIVDLDDGTELRGLSNMDCTIGRSGIGDNDNGSRVVVRSLNALTTNMVSSRVGTRSNSSALSVITATGKCRPSTYNVR